MDMSENASTILTAGTLRKHKYINNKKGSLARLYFILV